MADSQDRSSLELLYHISRELAATIDLRTVLPRILSLSVDNIGGERGTLIVLDSRGQPLDAAIVIDGRILDPSTESLKDTLERGLAGWVLRHGLPALIPDTSQDSRWARRPDDAEERSGAKSAICVLLKVRDQQVGILTVVHPQPGFFNEGHFSLLQAIADQAGVTILNSRLYEDSQRQARVMTALAENALTLNASLHLDEVLQRILNQTAQALQAEVILLALIDPRQRNELVFNAATGSIAREVIGLRIPLGQGIAGLVALHGKGMVLTDTGELYPARNEGSEERRLAAAANPAGWKNQVEIPGLEVHSLVCAPVQSQERLIGIIEAVNLPGEAQNAESLLVLTGLGSQAGIAIQNAQFYERLELAHQRYRDLFEDSIDPIFITDLHGHILEASRQAAQLTGHSPQDLLSMQIKDLHRIHQEKVGPLFSTTSLPTEKDLFPSPAQTPGGAVEIANRTQPVITYESELNTLSDEKIPVEVYVHPVKMDETECLQWILRDITERKNLASLQDDLIGMIFHDLRSPLANVISSLDLLKTVLPAEQRDDTVNSVLSIANHSTVRIQRLVSALLDIRRLEAGQAITNYEWVIPAALVTDAVAAADPISRGKEQTISVHLADNLAPLWIDGDMIRRVMINLIENACKYSPPATLLRVGAQKQGNEVIFWVEDRGPGIPVGDQERIFDKFTRLTKPGSPKGFGLGLAFCRLAVQAHGGKIWVQNLPPTEGSPVRTTEGSPVRTTGGSSGRTTGGSSGRTAGGRLTESRTAEWSGSRFSFSLPIQDKPDR